MMEKITSRKELKERLEDARAVEIKAREGYEEDLITFSNFELKNEIQKIKIDEDKHIKLLTELIDMLS